MKRTLCATVSIVGIVLAGCEPKPVGGTRPGSGSGSATMPALCLHAPSVQLNDPSSGASMMRIGGTWMMSIPRGCGFDRGWARASLSGCTATNTCGDPIDPAVLDQLNQAAQRQRVMLAGHEIDVLQTATSVVFAFGSSDDLAGAIGHIGQVPAGPGSGTRPPTGGGTTTMSAIPCCPDCGRCAPADCETPPPVNPRFVDGCDATVCGAFESPPGPGCECYERLCSPPG